MLPNQSDTQTQLDIPTASKPLFINITMYELVRTQLYLNMVHGVVFILYVTKLTQCANINFRLYFIPL